MGSDLRRHEGKPSFYIAKHHGRRCVVMGIRGTSEAHDVLTDLNPRSEPFEGGYAHSGILTAAQWLLRKEAETLHKVLQENPGFRLVLTGHSLGAALLGLMLRETSSTGAENLSGVLKIPCEMITCWGLGSPSGVNHHLAITSPFINNVVLQGDVVARVIPAALEDLRSEIAQTECLQYSNRIMLEAAHNARGSPAINCKIGALQDANWRGCKKALSWPVMALVIGVLVLALGFGDYYPSSRMPKFVRGDDARVAEASSGVGRMLLQTLQGSQQKEPTELEAEFPNKYLRGYVNFGAELTKKKRLRKNKNREFKSPDEEGHPHDVLFGQLCQQFPSVALFLSEHDFYFFYILHFFSDSMMQKFFIFCNEFPRLRDILVSSPILMVYFVHLRHLLGHANFTILIKFVLPSFLVAIFLVMFRLRRFCRAFFFFQEGQKRS